MNLIANSYKFTNEGGITLNIKIMQTQEIFLESRYLQLCFSAAESLPHSVLVLHLRPPAWLHPGNEPACRRTADSLRRERGVLAISHPHRGLRSQRRVFGQPARDREALQEHPKPRRDLPSAAVGSLRRVRDPNRDVRVSVDPLAVLKHHSGSVPALIPDPIL